MKEDNKIWFFAGAETTNSKFNPFTSSFIRMMGIIAGDDFSYIRDIYFRSPMVNVIWALNHAQKPLDNPPGNKIVKSAFDQVTSRYLSAETNLVLISSSSGSVIAAQTACCLAMANKQKGSPSKPFHLVLGSSMISKNSHLFQQLSHYMEEGIIGTIIHDEIQDTGDNTVGMGGISRSEAYLNAFGIMFPFLSGKYNGPSFLNSHPEKGHIHRRRSMTISKTIDFINIIMIKHALAGQANKEKAEKLLAYNDKSLFT
ncbi:MAG TPA: hypothetical protein VJ963_10305 [Bacteroidales bacterium]|nr:hypothetical protein [Bacteroidales bacterium]